jgi:hypothetical protein
MLLAAVCISTQKLWSDAEITELLRFTNKSILEGDLNAKHPVWNSNISNPSSLTFLELFVICNFEISTPQYSTHYTRHGRGYVFNIVVHQNGPLLQHIVTGALDSGHLPIYSAFWTLLERWKLENLLKN